MTKREEKKAAKSNRRRLYLATWEEQKTLGVSFSEFCRAYGLSENNFRLFLETGADVDVELFDVSKLFD